MKNWHERVFFGLHFDLHANSTDTELGKHLVKEELIEQLRKVKPDFVQCDCKGHPGQTSYPTKVGVPAKGIIKDALKIWRDATKELDIPLVVHYSGVWDTAAIELHPEWGRRNSPKRKVKQWPNQEINELGRDRNMTCPLADYTKDYMIPQMLEVIEEYDVDGFWVDGECWASEPCYCDRCTELFKKETGISSIPEGEEDPYWDKWLVYNRKNFVEHVRKYTEAVHQKKSTCTVCSNWMYTVRQPDSIGVPIDYISGDFDWMWSCERANAEARFMDGRGISWDLMAWGFTSHGEMKDWVFKTVPALCQEAAIVMACGGAFMIYDTPNRSGELIGWHMDDIAEVAKFCREREAYCKHTKSVPQIAIIHHKDHFYSKNVPLFNLGEGSQAVEGALHCLIENGYHVDILSSEEIVGKINNYPLCVLPEQTQVNESTKQILEDYVAKGGTLIVSGVETTKLFDDLLDVEVKGHQLGEDLGCPIYLKCKERTVPAMGTWRAVEKGNSDIIEKLLQSRQTGINEKMSHYVAINSKAYKKGKIVGIYGPIFSSYARAHYPDIRTLIKNTIVSLKIEKLMYVEAGPMINVILREKDDNLFVNVINMSCEPALSPRSTLVQNVHEVGPVTVCVPMDTQPQRVQCRDSNKQVVWDYNEGILKMKLEKVYIHEIIKVIKN